MSLSQRLQKKDKKDIEKKDIEEKGKEKKEKEKKIKEKKEKNWDEKDWREKASKETDRKGGSEKRAKTEKTSLKGRLEGQRRMTSITRKIHWYWIRKKILHYFFLDLFLFCFGIFSFLYGWESSLEGGFEIRNERRIQETEKGNWKSLTYLVNDQEGEPLLEVPLWRVARNTLFFIYIVIVLQILLILCSYGGEERIMRVTLTPLNELALKADRLSRLSFSEDKYQVIEDAISHIQPGENDANSLSFGDTDLLGIEAAMNNLLKRMRETYQQQARFVNDASHELRTPIAVIQGYANLLDRWGKTDEKILEESIQAIKNESDHMSHLVEQLLFLARGDSGRTVLQMQKVSVASLMEEIYEESLLIDEDHRYRLARGEDITLQADAALLKQAVRILVDNASKYTPKGLEIELSYGVTSGKEAFLQVQDSGIGMKEEEVGHMFERFYRSDEVRSYAGTGLGLSIAKWIVDRHHGKFEILSRVGLGTRIRINLPVEA